MNAQWNTPPPLLLLPDEAAYRQHYEQVVCARGSDVAAYCGYSIRFFWEKFDDAFFESMDRQARDKSIFSRFRAERMPWIRWILENPSSIPCEGWDRDARTLNPDRFVVTMRWDQDEEEQHYIVIFQYMRRQNAKFITAFRPSAEMFAEVLRRPI